MTDTAPILKDPAATLDYTVDWSSWLTSDDTITASTFTVTGPDTTLTIDAPAPSSTTTTATVWLSGGTLDKRYAVTNHITTAQGRVTDRTLWFAIRNQ